jgi:hypothetical protein
LRDIVRDRLIPITTTAQVALEIANILANDTSNERATFLLQQFPNIERDFRSRFVGGVDEPKVFLTYLDRYIDNYARTFGVAETVTAEEIESVAKVIAAERKFEEEEKKGIEPSPISEPVETKSGEYQASFSWTGAGGYYDDNWESILLNPANYDRGDIQEVWGEARAEIDRQLKSVDRINMTQSQISFRELMKARIPTKSKISKKVIISIAENNPDQVSRLIQVLKGIRGAGIKMKGKKHMKGRGVVVAQVPVVPLGQFGNYMINMNDLADNIVTLKTKKNNNVYELPTQRVSHKVADVMRSILGGSIPSYEDIAELTNKDKQYLNKVLRRSKINSFKIPVVSKDAEQKDIDRFQILRGSIIAGNDSKELLKEFKTLLIKLKNEGKLPRREVNAVLEDLFFSNI